MLAMGTECLTVSYWTIGPRSSFGVSSRVGPVVGPRSPAGLHAVAAKTTPSRLKDCLQTRLQVRRVIALDGEADGCGGEELVLADFWWPARMAAPVSLSQSRQRFSDDLVCQGHENPDRAVLARRS